MKNQFAIWTALVFLSGCAFYTSRPVTDNMNGSGIQIGMTTVEVRGKIGDPYRMKKSGAEGQTKEVWIYKEYEPDRRAAVGGILTLGIAWMVSPSPTYQYMVFSNGRLVSVGMDVPRDPDLIIEKRDR